MTTIWSRVSRFRPAVGLAVSAVLISGMAAASLSGAGVPRAYADPYKDLTAGQEKTCRGQLRPPADCAAA